MSEVFVTNEFIDWYDNADDAVVDDIIKAVTRLEVLGVTLGYPESSSIKGSKYPLRELRIQSHGRPIRVFYIFDPVRNAVLLIGGDKTGDKRFYKRMIPLAERLWEEYLDERF